jgi:hypothetical protein
MKLGTAIATLLIFALTAAGVSTADELPMQLAQLSPAPAGEPTMVAQKAIQDAGHQCSLIVAATRLGDGSIRAVCNDGEIYRVFNFQGQSLAMKCSALKSLGVSGC